MDEKLLEETKEFVNKVKTSEVYVNYIHSKSQLDQKPGLKVRLDEFRKNAFEIQAGHNYGFYNSYEQLVNLKNHNDELLCNSIIKNYMDDEQKLTKMITDVIDCFIEEIDYDVDFLE